MRTASMLSQKINTFAVAMNHRLIHTGLLSLGVLLALPTIAQDEIVPISTNPDKGKFYFYWGYNRANYTKSDITLKGDGYEFTLHDAEAHDSPEPWGDAYYDPLRFTIPQFNFRIGYQISDKYSISGGWDHMKYVVSRKQTVEVSGYINESVSVQYNGTYSKEPIQLVDYFLKLEHTDGLNYVRFNLDRTETFWMSKDEKQQLKLFAGVGTGPMFPWTDFTFMGKRSLNRPHLSGWGVSGHAALRFQFLKHYFIQFHGSTGYINLWSFLTAEDTNERGHQSFGFTERDIVIGAQFSVFDKKAE